MIPQHFPFATLVVCVLVTLSDALTTTTTEVPTSTTTETPTTTTTQSWSEGLSESQLQDARFYSPKFYRPRCSEEKKYVCPVPGCGKNFWRKDTMSRHYKFKHPDGS